MKTLAFQSLLFPLEYNAPSNREGFAFRHWSYESKYFDNLVPKEKRDKIKDVEKTMLNTCIVDWGCEVPKLFLSPNVLNVYVCMEDKEGFKKYGVYTWPNMDYYLGQFEFHTFTPFCPYL